MARIPSAVDLGSAPTQGLQPRAVRSPTVRTSGTQTALANFSAIADDIQAAQKRQQKNFDAIQTGEASLAYDKFDIEETERKGVDDELSRPNIVADHQEWQAATQQSILDGLPEGVSDMAKFELKLKMDRAGLQKLKIFGAASIRASKVRRDQTIKALRNSHVTEAFNNPDFTGLAVEKSKTDLIAFDGTMKPNTLRAHAIDSERDITRAGIEGHTANGDADKARDLLADSSELFSQAEQKAIRGQIDAADRAAANKVRALERDHFASIRATGSGIAGLRDEAQKTMKPDEFTEFKRREGNARDFHSFTVEIQFATVPEIVRRLEAMRPKSGTKGFFEREQTFKAAQSARQQVIAQREKDAAASAMPRPDITKAFHDVQKGELPLKVAVTLLLKAQEEMGIAPRNRRVLTNAQVETIVGEWDGVPAEDRAPLMLSIQQQYGEHYPKVLKELVAKGLSGDNLVLTSFDEKDGKIATHVGIALTTGATALAKGLEPEVAKGIRVAAAAAIQPWAARVFSGATTKARISQVNSFIKAVEVSALKYKLEGETDPVKRAYNDIIGKKYDLDTIDTAYIPLEISGVAISPAAVESTAAASKTREIIENFDPEPIGSPGPLDPEAHREATIIAAVNSGFWVTSPDATGLILMVPIGDGGALPLLDRNGEMLEVDFIDATRFLREVPGASSAVGKLVRSRAQADRERRQLNKLRSAR